MHSETLKRFLAYSLLLAVLALPAASVKPQQRQGPPKDELPIVKGDCPKPITNLTLTATSPTSFVAADFNAGQLAGPQMTTLGDKSNDKHFLYTFQWKREERCCQITKAILTVKMKSNQSGQSKNSPDAGNDQIAIMSNGNLVPPYNELIYMGPPPAWSFNVNQPATKTWPLNQTALNNINASGDLSFVVGDDTRVESATLQLWGCCLRADAPQIVGYTTQKECEEHEKAPGSVQIVGWHRTN